jgi:hypothetical protein
MRGEGSPLGLLCEFMEKCILGEKIKVDLILIKKLI